MPLVQTLTRALAVALTAAFLGGCQGGSKSDTGSTPAAASTAPPASAAPAAPVGTGGPTLSGDRAYTFLKDQCAFGPRVPNTTPHDECQAYIVKQLTPYVDKVVQTPFDFRDDARGVTLHLTNIMGVINPTAPTKIMLFTHWDTRPTADQELDAANKKKPIPGADDGASGTAVQLELVRALHAQKPAVCVELLFVDGEDWGPGEDKMYLGAIQFAKHPGTYKPDYAILLDMIGQKDLRIPREQNSQALHPDLNDKVWAAAAALGNAAQFPDTLGPSIGDDHLPFNNAGIPAIDLIDFDYAYWHTLRDTPDKCSPQSLKVVGDVMEKVIYDAK